MRRSGIAFPGDWQTRIGDRDGISDSMGLGNIRRDEPESLGVAQKGKWLE